MRYFVVDQDALLRIVRSVSTSVLQTGKALDVLPDASIDVMVAIGLLSEIESAHMLPDGSGMTGDISLSGESTSELLEQTELRSGSSTIKKEDMN